MKSYLNFQKGQSIVEIIAAIAIGAVLILALVALSVRSSGSADFSKVESQATRLAAEGQETLRNLQAVNDTYLYYSASCGGAIAGRVTWSGFFSPSVGDVDDACSGIGGGLYGKKARFQLPVFSSFGSKCSNSSTDPKCLVMAFDNVETINDSSTSRSFQRQVYIADSPVSLGGKSNCNQTATDWQQIKQFTVVVSWTDTSGVHDSVSTTCLQAN